MSVEYQLLHHRIHKFLNPDSDLDLVSAIGPDYAKQTIEELEQSINTWSSTLNEQKAQSVQTEEKEKLRGRHRFSNNLSLKHTLVACAILIAGVLFLDIKPRNTIDNKIKPTPTPSPTPTLYVLNPFPNPGGPSYYPRG